MYNKKIKKNIKSDKKVKFTKKQTKIEEISILELMSENKKQDPIIEESTQNIDVTPVTISSNSAPDVEMVETKSKSSIKTNLKKPKDKSKRKKSKFTKKELPKNVEIGTIITSTAAIDDEPIIIKSEPKPIDEPVIIHTPFIVEFIPSEPKPEKKENPYQIELYEYIFTNYEPKNEWSFKLIKDKWSKTNHPKLNTWIVNYFCPKSKPKQWYKTVHYFTTTEMTDIPPISPNIFDSDGC